LLLPVAILLDQSCFAEADFTRMIEGSGGAVIDTNDHSPLASTGGIFESFDPEAGSFVNRVPVDASTGRTVMLASLQSVGSQELGSLVTISLHAFVSGGIEISVSEDFYSSGSFVSEPFVSVSGECSATVGIGVVFSDR
jgi:hypothetical protein